MNMLGRTLLLVTCLSGISGAPGSNNKHARTRDIKQDVLMKPKHHGVHKISQGECMEGWIDASSVDLGCINPDLSDIGAEEPVAENVCRDFGEGGRLIEIFNMDQMNFLQDVLMQVEIEAGIEAGFIWYWIGLNDIENEDDWVWPVHGPANFTYWDVEFDEPLPGTTLYCQPVSQWNLTRCDE